jgi:plasmid stabilization system protein ParE
MKLIWGRGARRDLRELIAHIAEDSVQAAEVVAARILNAAELLTEFPRSGRIGRVSGTRERVVAETPYILVYRIASGRVRILRVYHGARKWPASF